MPKFTDLALRRRQFVNLGCRSGVDVKVLNKGVFQMLVAGERGDDAKLYLRVVGGKQRVVVVAGNEGFADFASSLGADGYVLQVGIAGAESSGGCNCLVENGMQTAVGGRDEPLRILGKNTLRNAEKRRQRQPEAEYQHDEQPVEEIQVVGKHYHQHRNGDENGQRAEQ